MWVNNCSASSKRNRIIFFNGAKHREWERSRAVLVPKALKYIQCVKNQINDIAPVLAVCFVLHVDNALWQVGYIL